MGELPGPDQPRVGSDDLRLPAEFRGPLRAHVDALREAYQCRGWGGRVGFGSRPAVVVIDLARYWLDAGAQIGSHLDTVVEATCRILTAALAAGVPVFFFSDPHLGGG